MALGVLGNDMGQGGLACAWWSVKDQGAEPVCLEHAPQQLAGTEEVLLADKLVDGARPHSRRQRLRLARVGLMDFLEQMARLLPGQWPSPQSDCG